VNRRFVKTTRSKENNIKVDVLRNRVRGCGTCSGGGGAVVNSVTNSQVTYKVRNLFGARVDVGF
jgi:hypothetical protein